MQSYPCHLRSTTKEVFLCMLYRFAAASFCMRQLSRNYYCHKSSANTGGALLSGVVLCCWSKLCQIASKLQQGRSLDYLRLFSEMLLTIFHRQIVKISSNH